MGLNSYDLPDLVEEKIKHERSNQERGLCCLQVSSLKRNRTFWVAQICGDFRGNRSSEKGWCWVKRSGKILNWGVFLYKKFVFWSLKGWGENEEEGIFREEERELVSVWLGRIWELMRPGCVRITLTLVFYIYFPVITLAPPLNSTSRKGHYWNLSWRCFVDELLSSRPYSRLPRFRSLSIKHLTLIHIANFYSKITIQMNHVTNMKVHIYL